QALKDAALAIQDWYRRFPGVFNLSDDLRRGKPELRLSLREEAHNAGIGADAIAQQLRGAFKGITADEIQVGSESYEIDVRMTDADRNSRRDLHDFMIVLPDGRQAPLRSLVTWAEGRGWARIGRFNRQRTVTVIGEIDTRLVNNNELAGLFRQQVMPDLQQRYPGVEVSFAGELTETRFARKSMLKALAMGMVGIFILLSFQFRTYTEPLIVMIAIPFSIIGIIWGHVLMGVPISMPSLLGFIAMAGVVVNDSILLVLFLKNARQEGQALPEAAVAASRDRFRAILMTSSTTIAGLLPILLERSLQAQILKPLIISTAFGLMASTVLVLFALPCFYVILGDIGWIESQASIDKHHLK
ncbi:MAG: efflux RND transporter permease subunit, partial [Lentisphaerae bacterium]|nr:efflux RND transporter permease subunit [Lentisphaerota bacterium]